VLNVKKETVKSTDQVIEALYDVADLQQHHADLHELLCTFALLPAENHPQMVLAELLNPDDKPGLKRALDQLAQKGWLTTDGKTCRISPVVQKILLQRNAERRWELGEPIVKHLQQVFETEGYHAKNNATEGPFAELVFGLADNLELANNDLAMVFDRLWVYHTAIGNLAKAMDTAQNLRELSEKSGDKNGLAISYSKLGETHTALGHLPQALTSFEDASSMTKELHEAYPQNVSFKNGLAVSYAKFGWFYFDKKKDHKKTQFYYEQCQALHQELAHAYPDYVEFQNRLNWVQNALKNLDS